MMMLSEDFLPFNNIPWLTLSIAKYAINLFDWFAFVKKKKKKRMMEPAILVDNVSNVLKCKRFSLVIVLI
jgi:hypothetical protein